MNPMMNPQQNRPSFGRRATSAFTRLFVTLLILSLGGLVAFLLSERNARTFTLALENGQLVVMKGRMLPMGAVPYQPGDGRLADAYAPLSVEGRDVSFLMERPFREREELDRALFPVLEGLAQPKVQSDDPELLAKGLYYLRRAELLSGLTEEQRRTLETMKADVSFFQARQQLEEARRNVTEALTQLKLAAESRNRNTQRANQMLSTVGPAAQALEKALRAVDASLLEPGGASTPAETPIPPPAAPQQTPGATTPGATAPAAPEQKPGVRTTDSETQQHPAGTEQPGTGTAR
ncbi:IF-2 protein [Vitiosangium sp. GDMCC 1.1324]|uniref:IF-2 protein n=1 Tax=Vitiosangium sp. (strain GDMCC 1.1324) TaxID=2138576 RepID=UPI0018EE649D|nr:IF-2 protein [Vitiosangium sp. GDMCC 1.1324]